MFSSYSLSTLVFSACKLPSILLTSELNYIIHSAATCLCLLIVRMCGLLVCLRLDYS